MTKQEAINIIGNITGGSPQDDLQVDVFVALGILKLEEPKSRHKAFCRAYNTLDEEGHHAAQILSLLDGAGLKIVEKD